MRIHSQVSRHCAHVELRHARAIAGAHACISMKACTHVARLRHVFEENVIAWTEGIHDSQAHERMCMHAMPRMSSGRMSVQSQARMHTCRCTHARMSRCCSTVSKSTYSPGQKEHVIRRAIKTSSIIPQSLPSLTQSASLFASTLCLNKSVIIM
jgi:hypothetical protein